MITLTLEHEMEVKVVRFALAQLKDQLLAEHDPEAEGARSEELQATDLVLLKIAQAEARS